MGEDGDDEGEIEGEIAKEVLEMYTDQAGRQNTDQGEKISRDVMKFSGSLNIEGDSKVSGSLNIGGSVTIAESLKVGEHGEGAIWGTVHGKQADHAEWMPRHDPKEELHPGDVVALTPDIDGRQLKVSRSAFGSERAEWTVVPTEPQILGHYPPANYDRATDAIASGAKTEAELMSEWAPMGLEIGTVVKIKNLKSRPELNGCEATVIDFRIANKRYGLQLSGGEGEKIVVKPDNIQEASARLGSASGQGSVSFS
ncbi:hypothetical protein Ctob_014985 [Chrysochromulina tobinii]|uniref:Uncharacterized protein n=1 Tax=Chrysochromulina tobinii TaxID=1460289 RepID=A0A0M0JYG7_9EUKA|nr:hypothetical protein Ctob_014985 [Chrysochromulina tobinii]|eukprot:KOO31696.1 hypothetical protein Ctob_014985 [Chrysochromulina sp. CCMP291]